MDSLLLILFIISLPVFWIWGLVSFIRSLLGKKATSPETDQPLLAEIVSDLNKIKNKEETVAKVLEKYKLKLQISHALAPETSPILIPQEETKTPRIVEEVVVNESASEVSKPNLVTQDVNDWWDRWYQENNINLLLYIGAFLIVSSAAIFVGFNWATFSGAFKALILSGITAAFFGAGLFFYTQTPKLKNAGATFIAIGSLLIPFNGLAWYNFYFHDLGVSFSLVWTVTSAVALVTYFFLAYFIRNRFYTYIAGLGGLSLVEALVNVSSLNSQFYILGGIFSAFVLLAGSRILAATKKEEFERIYSQPLAISSNVVMPIFLTWGLTAAYASGQLFTWEVSISSFLATAYYFLSYLSSKNITLFVLGELLLSLTAVLTTKTLGYNGAPVFIVVFALALFYQIGSYFLRKNGQKEEAYYSVFVATFSAILGLAISFVDPQVFAQQRVFFSLIVGVLALIATLLENSPTYLYITAGAVDLAAFYQVQAVWQNQDYYKYLSLFYSLTGSLVYLASSYLNSKKPWSETLQLIAYLNLFLALVFTLNNAIFMAISAAIVFLVASINLYFFKENRGYYNYLVSLVITWLALFVSLIDPAITPEKRVIFTSFIVVLSFLATYLENQPFYLYSGFIALDIAAYQVYYHNFNLTEPVRSLGLTYLGLGAVLFIGALLIWKDKQKWAEIILHNSALNLALAVTLTFIYPGLSLITTLTILVIGIVGAFFFKHKEYLYASILFALFSTYNILRLTNSPVDYYPLAFVATGYIIYLLHLVELPQEFRQTLQLAGLATAALTPIIFGIYSLNNYYTPQNNLELYSLISAYAATGLLTFDALGYKKGAIGYLASAFGLGTILWQLKYLGVHEFQAYAVTTGLYFLILAYVKRGQGKQQDRTLFDFIGLAVLLGPLTLQAFPENGFWYAVLLGIEGALLVFSGFSFNYKTYIYAGAAAIALATLSRIINFIASLPSWATVGLGGLVFLGVAIFLLNRRKIES